MRCPKCGQEVEVWHLQPSDRYKYHLKHWGRLWALAWWNKQLSWCPGGFEPVEVLNDQSS